MVPITTFSPELKCDSGSNSILQMSKNIFDNDKTNKYSQQLNIINNDYNNDFSLDNSNKVLRNLLNLNINLNKIISCNKTEADRKKKVSTENSEILKQLNSEIEKYTKEQLQRNSKVKITEQKNNNIDIYYIVYIVFISLLLVIQSSIVLFK